MPKLGNFIKYVVLAILVLIILVVVLSFVTQVGDKTLVDEKIVLSSGGEKTYNLPPGMTYIEFQSSGPLSYHYESLDGSGDGRGVVNGSIWRGSLLFGRYTITNNGTADASVDLSIKTGVLNPYSYI
jgi:hypothetical protein